jgi:ABC-2 type transport system permease protein
MLLVCGGIMLLEALILGLAREFSGEIEYFWLQRPFMRRLIGMLVGAEISGDVMMSAAFVAVGFIHPVMLALSWGFLLATCSRVIVGEIERGTADLLLTLPVSRAAVYTSVSAVWMLTGLPICFSALLGSWIGKTLFPLEDPVNYGRLAIVTVNLYAMYLAVGSATLFASSVASRRGPAISCVLAVLLASFLLNFLAQFWSAAQPCRFFGILEYYRPLEIVLSGDWPVRNLGVLLALGLVLWLAGLWRFARRDIPAV